MDFATLVLREVPPSRVYIDLNTIEATTPFRGFALVPPGPHVVRIGEHSLWCWLQPGQVQVYAYDAEEGFRAENGVAKATFTQLVRSGAINGSLVPYNLVTFFNWQMLTRALREEAFPGELHHADPFSSSTPTSLERELLFTHRGDKDALIAEFQMAFVRWLLSDAPDQAALRRWGALLHAVMAAETPTIIASPQMFSTLGGIIVAQFEQLGDGMFARQHPIMQEAHAFALRLIETNVDELIEKGSRLRIYLAQRGLRAS